MTFVLSEERNNGRGQCATWSLLFIFHLERGDSGADSGIMILPWEAVMVLDEVHADISMLSGLVWTPDPSGRARPEGSGVQTISGPCSEPPLLLPPM